MQNDSLTPLPVHTPVLLEEILTAFLPLKPISPLIGLDATFGRGGHARRLLESLPSLKLIAIDQDETALDFGRKEFASEIATGRLQLRHTNFANFDYENHGNLNLILVDLGVSSPQLDEAHRGFSFYEEGPLDMRMNQKDEMTASDAIHTLEEQELIDVFKNLGEVRSPFRVVRAIVNDRKTKHFNSTLDLAAMIERIDGWRVKGRHPATQYFLALRLYINQELEVTRQALPKMIDALAPGGRLAVISFHSLEDRIIKYIFRDSDLGRPVNKKVIEASEGELKQNPRSRSAKLRVFEKDSGLEKD